QRVAKDGRILDLSLTISPIKDSFGNVIGASKIARDITNQKQLEQAVRESEERFRTVADTAPVMIWMSGTDKGCEFFNAGWLKFRGRTLEEELGFGWTEGLHSEERERALAAYTAAFDERKPFHLESRFLRADGRYRWVTNYGIPRYAPDGTFMGYIGSCLDITERREMAEELEREVVSRTAELQHQK